MKDIKIFDTWLTLQIIRYIGLLSDLKMSTTWFFKTKQKNKPNKKIMVHLILKFKWIKVLKLSN